MCTILVMSMLETKILIGDKNKIIIIQANII